MERVADASGLDIGETVVRLRELSDRGLVKLDPGPFGGWGLTESGRVTDDEWVRDELELVDGRDQVQSCYESFLGLNPTLLQICSDWQMRRVGNMPELNDHTDPDYDAKVLSRLIRIDASAQRICSDLASLLTRFGLYGTRLTACTRASPCRQHRLCHRHPRLVPHRVVPAPRGPSGHARDLTRGRERDLFRIGVGAARRHRQPPPSPDRSARGIAGRVLARWEPPRRVLVRQMSQAAPRPGKRE